MNAPSPVYYKKNTWQKTFEVTANEAQARTLNYFIKNELAYYQVLSTHLGIRMRAFPQDFVDINPGLMKLFLFAARNAVDMEEILKHPVGKWPTELQGLYTTIYGKKSENLISSGSAQIIRILATPCHLHTEVRKNIALEVLAQISSQSEILHASQHSTEMRSPVQILFDHDFNTKHHVQIPHYLIKMAYNAVDNQSEIKIPYCHDPLILPGQDITDSKWDIMVISQINIDPSQRHMLQMSMRTTGLKYLINYSDGKKPNTRLK